MHEPDFNADARSTAPASSATLTVVLTGNADLNVKAMLDHFLGAVHEHSQRQHIPEVEVDVRKLEFMNSSCLKCLVGWISRIQDSPPGRAVPGGLQVQPDDVLAAAQPAGAQFPGDGSGFGDHQLSTSCAPASLRTHHGSWGLTCTSTPSPPEKWGLTWASGATDWASGCY